MLRVGDHDDGGALGIQLGEQVHDLLAVLRVEVTRRLVGKDEFGLDHYGTGDGNALLLTAGELLRIVTGTVTDGHAAHDFRDALLAFGSRHTEVLQRQLDVLLHGEFVDEVERLEDETDLSAPSESALALFQMAHFHAVQPVAALRGIVQQTEDVQQRRFAAARRTHDGDELAVLHFQCDAPEGRGLHHICAEDLLDVL